MAERTLRMPEDADEIARLSRTLAQSGNARVLAMLMERREEGDREDDETARPDGDGWMYLSEIAKALDEAPGTVGSSIAKLQPLIEERRVKGRRFIRSRVHELTIQIDRTEGF